LFKTRLLEEHMSNLKSTNDERVLAVAVADGYFHIELPGGMRLTAPVRRKDPVANSAVAPAAANPPLAAAAQHEKTFVVETA
jgi:hypothetical protein